MDIEILDSKTIAHRSWYLCKGNLLTYLESLKPTFYDFAIQRRIVKNPYLDTLYKTVKAGDPIPIITLTYKEPKLAIKDNKALIDMKQIEILDGLQRTFRLWAYKVLADRYNGETDKAVTDFAKSIKSDNPMFFESGVMSISLIRNLISNNEISYIKPSFDDFSVYFIVWAGLQEKEIIEKMLVLNAGQKSVSKTHQFELLFLHFYEDIVEKQTKVKLYREKDESANSIKRGNRNIGDFMFSSIIVALQSFVEMKPQRVSTDDLIGVDSEQETQADVYESVFSSEFIKIYLDELYKIDEAVYNSNNDYGKEWFVKDTTLSGVFAAVGKYININETWTKKELAEFSIKGFSLLRDKILSQGFHLSEFTKEYNALSSRQVNIGGFIRRVIMDYTQNLLEDGNPNWKTVFENKKRGHL